MEQVPSFLLIFLVIGWPCWFLGNAIVYGSFERVSSGFFLLLFTLAVVLWGATTADERISSKREERTYESN